MPKLFEPVKRSTTPDIRHWHSCKLQNLNTTRFEEAVNNILNGRCRLVAPKREVSVRS